MPEFKLNDVITADIDYEKISMLNNQTIDELKKLVVNASISYEYYSDIRGLHGDLPFLAKNIQLANDIAEGNGNELMKEGVVKLSESLSKISKNFITPAFASRVAGTLGWLLTPVSAPSGGNAEELRKENVNKAIRTTLSSMLFYFINENKIDVKQIQIYTSPQIDNTQVHHEYEPYEDLY